MRELRWFEGSVVDYDIPIQSWRVDLTNYSVLLDGKNPSHYQLGCILYNLYFLDDLYNHDVWYAGVKVNRGEEIFNVVERQVRQFVPVTREQFLSSAQGFISHRRECYLPKCLQSINPTVDSYFVEQYVKVLEGDDAARMVKGVSQGIAKELYVEFPISLDDRLTKLAKKRPSVDEAVDFLRGAYLGGPNSVRVREGYLKEVRRAEYRLSSYRGHQRAILEGLFRVINAYKNWGDSFCRLNERNLMYGVNALSFLMDLPDEEFFILSIFYQIVTHAPDSVDSQGLGWIEMLEGLDYGRIAIEGLAPDDSAARKNVVDSVLTGGGIPLERVPRIGVESRSFGFSLNTVMALAITLRHVFKVYPNFMKSYGFKPSKSYLYEGELV